MSTELVDAFNQTLLEMIENFRVAHPDSGVGKYYYYVRMDNSDKWLKDFHENSDRDAILSRCESVVQSDALRDLGIDQYMDIPSTRKVVYEYLKVLSDIAHKYHN